MKPRASDRVRTDRRGDYRSEPDFAEAQIVVEMAVNLEYIRHLGRECDPGADGTGFVPRQQRFHFWRDDVVAPAAVVKHAKLVVHLAVAVQADSDPDPVCGQKLNHFLAEQGAICGQTEIDRFAGL